jgi:hypothetical protein
MLQTAQYDEDENVRYDALLLYQEHPKSKVINLIFDVHRTPV